MLEALEKIKNAEEQNELKKEQLKKELASYEDYKKQQLQEKRQQLKAAFSQSLAEREETFSRELAAEEQRLAEHAEVAIKQMEENYLGRKEPTIQKIIERVIAEYGSQ